MFRSFAVSAFAVLCLVPPVFSETPAKVDFARDVQPIFRQNCIGCHGPTKQNNGLRLDRRSSVMKPGSRRVMPGSLENSFLYHRLVGSDFGLQMPPTGALHPEQIQIIKAWIEQGAEWPDSWANEIELPPLNAKAVSMVETLRAADRQAFNKMVAEDPKLLNARGPEGSTPFLYAVLYTDAATLERLIQQGADPNKRNDAGATALMWAALDLEKTRVLVAHGADVNARSDDARTALMVAAGRPGGAPIVKLLLAHGANPNPTSNPGAESSPLLEASLAGDAEIMQALLDHGADLKDIGGFALANAAGADCAKCVDLLVARNLDAMQYTIALGQVVVLDNPNLVRLVLQHGADVNAPDPTGRTALIYAAVSDLLPVEQVKMLIEKKADVNAKSQHPRSGDTGLTALDLAKLHGNTAVVDLLLKSGAISGAPAVSIQPASMRRGNTIQAAVATSLPLLQRTDASFVPKAGCFSCHNQSIAAMAVGLARKNGFQVDEQTAARQVKVNAGALQGSRDLLHQGFFIPGINASPAILAYVLLGLDAEGYKPDLSTDAVAMYIQTHQMADGHWVFGPEARPPLCADALGQTVVSMRGLELYAPRVDKAAYAKSIQLAGTWIGEYRPRTNYDLAWRLQGLVWGGKSQDTILKARRDLLAAQRSDGGWSDLASMESGAYTTGLAMIALQSSGLPVSDPAYQRGVQYLLNTQLEDGSWHVRTRAAGFQPYFDNGFPHGVDQWISAAGTSLATIALTLATPPPGGSRTAAVALAQR
ncbi:MAG: ankyrin repeat domain-containing protein [Bryobacteraceae bacterium]|jgi:ankyrin repeat protein